MKKILTLVALFATVSAYALPGFTVDLTPPNAWQMQLAFANGRTISVMEFTRISVKGYEELSGKKLNFFKRIFFRSAQRRLAKSISADGKIKDKKFLEPWDVEDHTAGFHLGGFLLGLLGPVGVLIAYLFHDKAKANRRKWAWIGMGVLAIFFLILIITKVPFFLVGH